jgi:hypothetical protein
MASGRCLHNACLGKGVSFTFFFFFVKYTSRRNFAVISSNFDNSPVFASHSDAHVPSQMKSKKAKIEDC